MPGDIARWMLEYETEYSFLVSSDEIMLIRFTPIPASIRRCYAGAYGIKRRIKSSSSLIQPELFYSDPIKHTQVLDERDERNVKLPVKLALLHLMHRTVIDCFKMMEEKGKCALYFPTTAPGEKFIL